MNGESLAVDFQKGDGLVPAIVLYEEAGPEWRLEALRRLLARAARDPLAATAARRILEGAP